MKPEDQVLSALRALADHDREREASEAVELRLRTHFRRTKMRRTAMWWLAAAAAVVVALLAVPRQHRTPSGVTQPEPPPEIARITEPPAPQISPVHRKAAPQPPREIVTEFFPLMDVALPFERGQLLRVVVPAATLRTVGLPVNEDRLSERVQADVLVGEEGLARAIRFVRYEQ